MSFSRSGGIQVRLWATDAPYTGTQMQGYRLAEIILDSLPGYGSYSGFERTVPYSAPPPGTYQVVMTLGEWSNGSYQIVDYVNFNDPTYLGTRLEFSGRAAYRFGRGAMALEVGRIRNHGGSSSGPLQLQLWATRSVYRGRGTIEGFQLGVASLGILGGNRTWSDVEKIVPYRPPPEGNYSLTMVLAEKSGGEFYTVDHHTFSDWSYFGAGGSRTSPLKPMSRVTRGGDFDGDGLDDVVLFRPGTGQWYMYGSRRGFTAVRWGMANDLPAPADYDGDGVLELGVFRPSNGKWFYQGGPAAGVTFGLRGDLPVPADYDGDGKADLAVYRVAAGGRNRNLWAYLRSVDGRIVSETHGVPGDLPLVGDYSGNRRADLAVFRPGIGSLPGLFVIKGEDDVAFGMAGDIPVVQDFDGDGITDKALFRPRTGTWFHLPSTGGAVVSRAWGAGSDIPVPGKYDSDSRADYAVFRPRNRKWFILQSTGGNSSDGYGVKGVPPVRFGLPTDLPVTGHFDTDNQEDYGIYRRSTGTWHLQSSEYGPIKRGFYVDSGSPGDIPVMGNWDHNDRTDFAFFRPSTGRWFVRHDRHQLNPFDWGLPGDTPVPGDYDNDGVLEPGVYRNGLWFLPGRGPIQWGTRGDLPFSGDFDGNGYTDIAVYRPRKGIWYLRLGGAGGTLGVETVPWGMPGDRPMVKDVNRDGRDDLIVFRPRNGRWFIRYGAGDSGELRMGAPGDVPLMGDFDGDGVIDPALFRRGQWFILDSGTGKFRAQPGGFHFGGPGDIPIGRAHTLP